MRDKKRPIVRVGLALAAIVTSMGMAPQVSWAADPPSAPEPKHPNQIYGGGDGGTYELGTWCIEDFPNPADDRWGWCNSADSLRSEAGAMGWQLRWNYRNSLAWEEDWKKRSSGGTEDT